MPEVEFYYMVDSPPCRSVQMLIAALGLEVNNKLMKYEENDHMKPEFVKMNPQHIVPTIKDGDFVLWESRPIMGYLVNKYAKDDTLYPKDPVKRALVDQRLYFDMGTLYQRYIDYYFSQIMQKAPADPEKYKKIKEAFEFLNTFLGESKYAAGDHLTIADFSLMSSVSGYVDGGPNFPLTKYPNVQRWYEDCKINIPGYDSTVPGLESLKTYFADIPAPVEEED